ncbi:MAG: hypothetical protein KBC02_02255 [Candidatus Pacebacteria bacterium]|nr:hypothetical protein [Candidatus Paceibacterota bacterium]
MSNMSVNVVSGDITRVEADGLITTINSSGQWHSEIDHAIQKLVRRHMHGQAFAKSPLTDGQTVVAYGYGHSGNRAFKHVVFAIDDNVRPLVDVVVGGLMTANNVGLASVTLPLIHMGARAGGIVEKSGLEIVAAMDAAIKKFQASNPKFVREITLVVNNDESLVRLARAILHQ